MKDLEKIKNEVSVKHGFSERNDVLHYLYNKNIPIEEVNDMENEVATEYARQMCDEQISDCYDFANGYHFENIDSEHGSEAVNKILNTPNVVTTK